MIKFISRQRFKLQEERLSELWREVRRLQESINKVENQTKSNENRIDSLTSRNRDVYDYGDGLNLWRITQLLHSILEYLNLDEVPPNQSGYGIRKRISKK